MKFKKLVSIALLGMMMSVMITPCTIQAHELGEIYGDKSKYRWHDVRTKSKSAWGKILFC